MLEADRDMGGRDLVDADGRVGSVEQDDMIQRRGDSQCGCFRCFLLSLIALSRWYQATSLLRSLNSSSSTSRRSVDTPETCTAKLDAARSRIF